MDMSSWRCSAVEAAVAEGSCELCVHVGVLGSEVSDLVAGARVRDSLPNGYCGRPPQQHCPHPNACLTCPDFQTTPEFLDVHRQQATTNKKLTSNHPASRPGERSRAADEHATDRTTSRTHHQGCPERARDNASTTDPKPPARYIEDTANRTPDMCRYVTRHNGGTEDHPQIEWSSARSDETATSVQNPTVADTPNLWPSSSVPTDGGGCRMGAVAEQSREPAGESVD